MEIKIIERWQMKKDLITIISDDDEGHTILIKKNLQRVGAIFKNQYGQIAWMAPSRMQ